MSDQQKDPQKNARRAESPVQSTPEQERTPGAQAGPEGEAPLPPAGVTLDHGGGAERDVQYMITPRRQAPLAVLGFGLSAHAQPDMNAVHSALQAMNNVAVVRRIRSHRMALMGNGPGTAGHDIVVVRTPQRHARVVEGLAHPGLIVERDYLLNHLSDSRPRLGGTAALRPLSVTPASMALQFNVRDTTGAPQANCSIALYPASGGEAQASTDADGNVAIDVPIGSINEISAVYVKPFADCWELFAYRPALATQGVNNVVLHRLSDFPQAGFTPPSAGNGGFAGWGQRVMGLPQAAGGQGRGVKVAIVDSGCDNTHPALTHVRIGQDYTNLDADHQPDPASWNVDTMSHGTHCAGVIAGNGKNGHIRGFVPDAEIHVLKLFPGGAFNNLAAALHYCIDNQIDVVNCSLGGEDKSEAIEQLIDSARQAGVAVVVAAGNSSGPVQFPGSVPGVLCVAAIGQEGNYPDYTYHAQTCAPGTAVADGLFPANFSCYGPQVGLCAPGVAVISSVPGGGYAAWDGTSMAAPAVTGLLAMVLAHHPEFAGTGLPRNARRVDRLFQVVAQAAAPLGMPRPQSGAGLARVLAVQDHAAQPAPWRQPGVIDQAQLESLIRDALLAQLNSMAAAPRPPA